MNTVQLFRLTSGFADCIFT